MPTGYCVSLFHYLMQADEMIQNIHLNPAIEDWFPSHIPFCPWQSQCNTMNASVNGPRWGVGYSITAWVVLPPPGCSMKVQWARSSEVARWWVMVCVAAPLSPGNSFLFQWSDEDDDGWWGDPAPCTLIIRDRYLMGLDTTHFAHLYRR